MRLIQPYQFCFLICSPYEYLYFIFVLACYMIRLAKYEGYKGWADVTSEWAAGCGSAVDLAMHPAAFAGKVFRDATDFASLPDKSLGPQKVYTPSEVASLDGRDGRHLCLIICGGVYDITDFADFHPGGPDPLKKYAGQDATAAFRASGMPRRVYEVFLKRFQVGTVEGAVFGAGCN